MVRESAGFNVISHGETVSMELRARRDPDSEGATLVAVRLAGVLAGREILQPGERRRVVYLWPTGTVAYVELTATDRARGSPRGLLIVARPR